MSSTPIKAVIFDCDGTLVDSESLGLSVLIELVAEQGLEVSLEEAVERFAGNELSVVFKELEERLGRALPEDFLQNFRTRQLRLLSEQLQPITGVHDLLEALQLPFCVASNAPLDKISVCLETTDLKRHFPDSLIFSAYEINSWKPSPDLFLKAARHLNVAPEYCAVVEDSIFGLKAGLSAGMQVFGYDPHDRLQDDYPDVVCVSQLSELQNRLCGM